MKKLSFAASLFVLIALFVQCMNNPENKIRYAAIGDSYTIGTGAHPTEAWPDVLTNNLQKAGMVTSTRLCLSGNLACMALIITFRLR